MATALGLALLLAAGAAAGAEQAPAFSVTSGEGKTLHLADLPGKVVLLFYEKRKQVELNRPLKKELSRFYEALPVQTRAQLARVAVVDCASASWPFKGLWQDGLQEASLKEGLTIYGDWDGEMRKNYNLPEDQPSFLVLGPRGQILFRAVGPIGPERFPAILQIIRQAAGAEQAR
jgi:hypothetical protein